MPSANANYFTYLEPPVDLSTWGIAVTGVGYHRTPARSPYPTASHPQDYAYAWERGRTLDCLHMVLITSGRGLLETSEKGLIELTGGSAFIVPPGVWHRFRPDPKIGWEESWVELRGTVVDRLLAEGRLHSADLVHAVAMAGRTETTMKHIHGHARLATRSTPELAALGMLLLAHWVMPESENPESSRPALAIRRAEQILSSIGQPKISMPEVARKVGMAYSHFRREFKARTGRTPVEYASRVRLRQACRFLLSTDATLEEIAERVGFSSGFHLSTQFKKTFGLSPREWRKAVHREGSSVSEVDPRPSENPVGDPSRAVN